MRVIFLNGPPRSGKDYAGGILRDEFGGRIFKMAGELKERTHALYRQMNIKGEPLPHDYFEAAKDEPQECFLGLTPREAYIAVSERLFKPLYGQQVFGRLLAQQLEGDLAIITDSGFAPEAEPIVEKFGAENCLLARIHRAGYDFSSDSRSYIDLSHLGVPCLDIQNDGGSGFRASLLNVFRSSLA